MPLALECLDQLVGLEHRSPVGIGKAHPPRDRSSNTIMWSQNSGRQGREEQVSAPDESPGRSQGDGGAEELTQPGRGMSGLGHTLCHVPPHRGGGVAWHYFFRALSSSGPKTIRAMTMMTSHSVIVG